MTKLAHDGPQKSPHPRCAQGQGQGQGQRSRYTGTSVMSQNVCYTVQSHVLSLHALTLWNTIILSFQIQYKYQVAVYILEWATPSLTVWFVIFLCGVFGLGLSGECSTADITFANNVSVIPSSPLLRQPTVLRERNLAPQRRSCKLSHVRLLYSVITSQWSVLHCTAAFDFSLTNQLSTVTLG